MSVYSFTTPERVDEACVEPETYSPTGAGRSIPSYQSCASCEPGRRISVRDIEDAIASGQIIETHTDDWGFVCYLIAGERLNGDVIHIARKIVGEIVQINTVYFPHEHLWENNRIRKR